MTGRRPGVRRSGKRGTSSTDPRPLLVFLHGTRLSGGQWAVQVEELSANYRCLTPDLPGHGDAAGVAFTIGTAGDRVIELLEREASPSPGGKALVIGLSLGAYVALEVGARRPDLVAGIAVSGVTAEPVGVRALAFRGLALIFRVVPETVLERVNRWFFRHRYPPRIAEPIVAGGFWFPGGSIAVGSLVGERFKPRLARYPGPSLLLNGEFDLFFRPTERSFATAAVDARRVLIRRATHLANLDQPAAFTAAIRRFAERVFATSE
jgi:pimeloyl-ACP methyl ester carboxylesterase